MRLQGKYRTVPLQLDIILLARMLARFMSQVIDTTPSTCQ